MQWTSTRERFGLLLIALHWVMALMIIFLFFLGRFMTNLPYTHPWYHLAPYVHKSTGLIVMALLAIRTVWVITLKRPVFLPMPRWESLLALFVQKSFYFLLFGITISGYLIPTADGGGIEVFGLFTVPALFAGFEHQEDIAGEVHYLLTYLLMFFLALHTMGALKHHFIDRDETLTRMLGIHGKK